MLIFFLPLFIASQHEDEKIQVIVAYCSVGYRSSKCAQELYQRMKANPNIDLTKYEIYNLEGSIFKWANEGRHIVDDKGLDTKMVHYYDRIWCKFLNEDLRQTPSSL